MKIRPVGAELSHADGQTEMTKLIVAFRNFTIARKMFGKKVVEKIRTHILCSGTISRKVSCGKILVEPDRPQMTI